MKCCALLTDVCMAEQETSDIPLIRHYSGSFAKHLVQRFRSRTTLLSNLFVVVGTKMQQIQSFQIRQYEKCLPAAQNNVSKENNLSFCNCPIDKLSCSICSTLPMSKKLFKITSENTFPGNTLPKDIVSEITLFLWKSSTVVLLVQIPVPLVF